jgi:hypothetical protein
MFRLERGCARRRVVAWVQLALFLQACTSWQVEPVAPAELVSRKPSVVRVTLPDSSHVVLNDPVVRGDTLYGYRQNLNQALVKRPDAVPLDRVQEIAVLRSDPTKNTLLVVGLGVGAFSTLCLLADAFGCGPDEATVLPAFLGLE